MAKTNPKHRRAVPPLTTKGGAIDRLRAICPLGPPYYLLVLDEATCDALRHGAVNSRAVVEANRVWTSMQPAPLPKDYSA